MPDWCNDAAELVENVVHVRFGNVMQHLEDLGEEKRLVVSGQTFQGLYRAELV